MLRPLEFTRTSLGQSSSPLSARSSPLVDGLGQSIMGEALQLLLQELQLQLQLRTIGQTCEMEYGRNPLYCAPTRYLREIEEMMAGFRQADPIPVP